MNNPIINDPIAMVAEAFEVLYPGVKYEAAYAPDIRDGNGTIVCSCITFPGEEDGPDAVPMILINSQAGVEVAAYALAQELARAALGPDSLEGGPEYEGAVTALADKYKEIGDNRFPAEESEQPNGGDDDENE